MNEAVGIDALEWAGEGGAFDEDVGEGLVGDGVADDAVDGKCGRGGVGEGGGVGDEGEHVAGGFRDIARRWGGGQGDDFEASKGNGGAADVEEGDAVAAEAVDFEMAVGVGADGGVGGGEEWEAAEEGLGFVGVFGGEGVDLLGGAVAEHLAVAGDGGGGLAVGGAEWAVDGGVVGGELEAEVAGGVGVVPEGPGEAESVGGGEEGGAFPGGGHGAP